MAGVVNAVVGHSRQRRRTAAAWGSCRARRVVSFQGLQAKVARNIAVETLSLRLCGWTRRQAAKPLRTLVNRVVRCDVVTIHKRRESSVTWIALVDRSGRCTTCKHGRGSVAALVVNGVLWKAAIDPRQLLDRLQDVVNGPRLNFNSISAGIDRFRMRRRSVWCKMILSSEEVLTNHRARSRAWSSAGRDGRLGPLGRNDPGAWEGRSTVVIQEVLGSGHSIIHALRTVAALLSCSSSVDICL